MFTFLKEFNVFAAETGMTRLMFRRIIAQTVLQDKADNSVHNAPFVGRDDVLTTTTSASALTSGIPGAFTQGLTFYEFVEVVFVVSTYFN